MKLRGIHQIELTNRCNLSCRYCINRKMTRPRVDISQDVFENALRWYGLLRESQELPLRDEIALTGCGEPTLHPHFVEYVALTRSMFPSVRITISTNGVMLTPDVVRAIAPYHPEIYLSQHVSVDILAPIKEILANYGLLKTTNEQYRWASFDWAGQVDWAVTAQKIPCMHLQKGYGCVLSNGDIVTCCIDADGTHVVGNVMTDAPENITIERFALCSQCHMESA